MAKEDKRPHIKSIPIFRSLSPFRRTSSPPQLHSTPPTSLATPSALRHPEGVKQLSNNRPPRDQHKPSPLSLRKVLSHDLRKRDHANVESTVKETLVTQPTQPKKTPVLTKEGAAKSASSKLAVETTNQRDDIDVGLVDNTDKTLTVARPISLDLHKEPGGYITLTTQTELKVKDSSDNKTQQKHSNSKSINNQVPEPFELPQEPVIELTEQAVEVGPSKVSPRSDVIMNDTDHLITADEESTILKNPAFRNRIRDRKESAVHKILTKGEGKLTALQRPTSIGDILFDLLVEKDKKVPLHKFWTTIQRRGLRISDPRLSECRRLFKEKHHEMGSELVDFRVDRAAFRECVHPNINIINRTFKDELIIPEFYNFIPEIEGMFLKIRKNDKGKNADYIPQLSRVDRSKCAVSVCTIDGQRCDMGDSDVPFCIQSCSKPLTYGLAVSELGAQTVHSYVGLEPSGRSFNELTLDHNQKPHNPMINAGAIITSSLVQRKLHISDRFDYVFEKYKDLAGGEYVGFSNSVYLSERETADRNFCLGYYMRENKCFPDGADLQEALEFYFQLCSIEITAESGAVIAATLANGGVCPTTGQRVMEPEAVRNTLSLMYTCGMYDYSGEFAFKVGLPAKSGVAGAVLLVIPKVMGVCIWGPPLDQMGNSCRGVQFCEKFVEIFSFHNYDDLTDKEQRKIDPRRRATDLQVNSVVNLLFAAANADIASIHRFALNNMNMSAPDYDGRTALHLAAAEGHLEILQLLIEQCNVNPEPKDRWGFTPLDDAKKFNHTEVARYLKYHLRENRDPHQPQDDLESDPESDTDELQDAFPIKKPQTAGHTNEKQKSPPVKLCHQNDKSPLHPDKTHHDKSPTTRHDKNSSHHDKTHHKSKDDSKSIMNGDVSKLKLTDNDHSHAKLVGAK